MNLVEGDNQAEQVQMKWPQGKSQNGASATQSIHGYGGAGAGNGAQRGAGGNGHITQQPSDGDQLSAPYAKAFHTECANELTDTSGGISEATSHRQCDARRCVARQTHSASH